MLTRRQTLRTLMLRDRMVTSTGVIGVSFAMRDTRKEAVTVTTGEGGKKVKIRPPPNQFV